MKGGALHSPGTTTATVTPVARKLPAYPGLARHINWWRQVPFANSAVRREAKAILFGELAKAAKHQIPMDQALLANAQTVRESRMQLSFGVPAGADRRNVVYTWVMALLTLLLAQAWVGIYAILSFRYWDVERVARLLALRLHSQVAKGVPLSAAMKECDGDFDPEEVAIIAAGEKWQRLEAALQKLSQFQVTEARLSMQGAQILYPFFLAYILLTVGAFILIWIIPKFKDIFDQLGGELPFLTQWMIEGSYWFTRLPLVLLIPTSALLCLFIFVRAFANGNSLSILALSLTYVFGCAGLVMFVAVNEPVVALIESGSPLHLLIAFVGLLLLFCLLVAIFPAFLSGLEKTVLAWERRIIPLARKLPFVGGAAQVEAEARWLAAYSLGLESGQSAHESVLGAGRISGRKCAKRSEAAAGLVSQGHSVGNAAIRTQLLTPTMNHRLVLAERNPDYSTAVCSIAQDASQAAFEKMNRTGRITEVLAIVFLGLVVGTFGVALYLPLFAIPRIVINAGIGA